MSQLYISRLTCQQLPGRGGGPALGKVHSFLANHSQHAVGKSSLASALFEIRCKKIVPVLMNINCQTTKNDEFWSHCTAGYYILTGYSIKNFSKIWVKLPWIFTVLSKNLSFSVTHLVISLMDMQLHFSLTKEIFLLITEWPLLVMIRCLKESLTWLSRLLLEDSHN